MRRPIVAGFALAGIVACGSDSLEPLPFQVGVEASRVTGVPGDTINFLVSAQGGALIGVITDFGDGTNDQYGTSGARTARVTFRHAFKVRGTYTVTANVTDTFAGQKSASVEVRVN